MKVEKNNQDNGMNALKAVMAFALLLCAIVVGFAIELMIAGINIIYWSFTERGLWLLLWTAIAYAVLFLFSKDLFCSKIDNNVEENGE